MGFTCPVMSYCIHIGPTFMINVKVIIVQSRVPIILLPSFAGGFLQFCIKGTNTTLSLTLFSESC